MWDATHQNLYLRLLGCIGDTGLQMYLHTLSNALTYRIYCIDSFMNFAPSNLYLVSKQPVSEFLQDALSKSMR